VSRVPSLSNPGLREDILMYLSMSKVVMAIVLMREEATPRKKLYKARVTRAYNRRVGH